MQNKIISVISVLFVLCLVGCSTFVETPVVEINHEAEVCGVKDPYVNMESMHTIFNKILLTNEEYALYVYRDTIIQEDLIIAHFPSGFEAIMVFNCGGEEIISGFYDLSQTIDVNRSDTTQNVKRTSPPAPCYKCDSIMNRTIYKDIIYHKYYKSK